MKFVLRLAASAAVVMGPSQAIEQGPVSRLAQLHQPAAPAARLDRLAVMELEDYGVQPVSELYSGEMHGPTPASIPGGRVITTKGLVELMRGGQGGMLIFDVLGGPEMLPGAVGAITAHYPGSFDDQTQRVIAGLLQERTQGDKQTPLVFYCLSTHCWMSYNAALRAINMGYTNVLWYRGGIETWKAAGLGTQSRDGQVQSPPEPQPQPDPPPPPAQRRNPL